MATGKVNVGLKFTNDDDFICVVRCIINWSHDLGCWMTSNGDGWPESFDYDYKIIDFLDEKGTNIDQPEWLTDEMISNTIDDFTQNIDTHE